MPSRKRTPKPPDAEEPPKAAEAPAAPAAPKRARKPRAAAKAPEVGEIEASGSGPAEIEAVGIEAPETRAHDLLPAVAPAPIQPRKVGLRRVVGHALAERLLSRRAFRPAGNSRRFWRRVEADDPFLAQPASSRWEDEAATLQPGMTRAPAAAQRIPAEPSAKASPSRAASPSQPSAPRPSQAKPTPAQPKPSPQREAAPKVAPTPTHTPEPRPVPAPTPRPASERAPAPSAPAAPAIDRRPKIVPHQPQVRPGGRVAATPSNVVPRPHLVNKDGQSPDEVRREAEAARRGPPPPPRARSLDEILGILGDLQASERLYQQGLLTKEAEEQSAPAPKPAAASPQKAATPQRPAPTKAPAPKPAPPSRAATPSSPPARAQARPAEPDPLEEDAEYEPAPAPAHKPPSAPLDRSPSRAAAGPNGASLDDLFGAGDTRMKIGRRTVRKQPEPSSEDS